MNLNKIYNKGHCHKTNPNLQTSKRTASYDENRHQVEQEVDGRSQFAADLARHETGRSKIQETDIDTDDRRKKTNTSAKIVKPQTIDQ